MKDMTALFTAAAAMGMMDDVIEAVAAFTPPPECPLGCMPWSAAPNASAAFADAALVTALGARCAIPGRALHSLTQPVAPHMTAMEAAAFYGPICPCRPAANAPVEFHTCVPPKYVPQQINLQLANASTVVASFATHEPLPPTAAPVARLWGALAGPLLLEGVSHIFSTSHANGSKACVQVTGSSRRCSIRNLTMHFIRFPALEPRRQYSYQVRSGGAAAGWSGRYRFRAPYAGGDTRVAIYGDMGNDAGNNMGNLRADCASGAVDAVVHMGDHAYNMGNGDDLHGDAYMQAFQHVLARCPWIPVIGNHESTMGEGKDKVDASSEQRYLNQTWGVIYGEGGHALRPARTTATTSLGHLITRGSFYAAGSHGAAPSRTSQWFSLDLGLIHFVVLDLSPGPPAVFAGEQLAWAAADLAAADANRASVPWIVVTSHYPLYSAVFEGRASAAWYAGETAEHDRSGDGTPWSAMPSFETCADGDPTCTTVREMVDEAASTLGALLDEHHVDIYAAGHVHAYSVTWPLYGGQVTNRSLVDPKGTIHLVEGNGGVPGTARKHGNARVMPCSRSAPQEPLRPVEDFKICGQGMSYGRLLTTNASVLSYEHVSNANGEVLDTWAIVRTPK